MSPLVSLALSLPAVAILHVAVILIFMAFGVAKFASYEQKSIALLVAGHPILRHGPAILGEVNFSRLLGTVELFTAALLVLGMALPQLALLGGLLGAATFVVTLSLLPFVQYFEAAAGRTFLSSRGQFLFKDLALFGGCLVIAHHAAGLLA